MRVMPVVVPAASIGSPAVRTVSCRKHEGSIRPVSWRTRMPIVALALALGIATAQLSACGASSAVSSAAQSASSAISSAAAKVKSTTATTKTATTRTATTTTTKSASAKPSTQPGATISVTSSGTVNVQAKPTKPASTESGNGGLPWWGWVLIGMAIVAVIVAIFAAGRRRGETARARQEAAGAGRATSDRYPPDTEPPGADPPPGGSPPPGPDPPASR
jgi:hypothetical protein